MRGLDVFRIAFLLDGWLTAGTLITAQGLSLPTIHRISVPLRPGIWTDCVMSPGSILGYNMCTRYRRYSERRHRVSFMVIASRC